MTGPARSTACILGAAGAVGGLFARRMHDAGWSVTGVDRRAPAGGACFAELLEGDLLAPDEAVRDLLQRSACVVICLPEEAALRAASALPPSVGLVVDTLSVKTPICARLSATRLSGEHLSLNPMFAPSVGFEGQAVAVVGASRGPRSAAFVRMIEGWGARVVALSVDEHDRLCAVLQAATHGALLALAGVATSGFPVRELIDAAPPPHLTCLSLAARIAAAAPDTYWDIQRNNPYAGAIRRQLVAALSALDDAVERDDEAAFLRLLDQLRRSFGDDLERLCGAAESALRGASDARIARSR